MFDAIQSLDLSILTYLRQFQNPALVAVAWVISAFANKGWLFALIALAAWLRGKRDFSAQVAAAMGLAIVAGLPLKGLLGRARPDLYASQQLNIPMANLASTEHSFPSGHTLLAAAFAFVVVAYYRDARAWAAFVFVALVGVARVYGGYHWPSDIVGSAILGALAAVAAGHIVRLPAVQRLINKQETFDNTLAREFLVPHSELDLPAENSRQQVISLKRSTR